MEENDRTECATHQAAAGSPIPWGADGRPAPPQGVMPWLAVEMPAEPSADAEVVAVCHGCAADHALTAVYAAADMVEGPDGNLRCQACHDVHYAECCKCEETIERGDAETFDGRTYCADCYSEHFTACDRCDRTIPNDDIRDGPGDVPWCDRCYDRHAMTCDDCDAVCEIDDMRRTVDDRDICDSCYGENYFTCEGCSEVCHCDDCYGDYYCESCWDDKNESGTIQDYGTRAHEELPWHGPRDGILYGVELELECDGDRGEHAESCLSALGSDFAIAKEDGSLNHGFELVTAPATVAVHAERWGRLLGSAAAKRGLKSWKTSTCGMHVHVSRAPLGNLTVGKIITFMGAPGNKRFIERIAGRDSCCFARITPKKVSDAVCRRRRWTSAREYAPDPSAAIEPNRNGDRYEAVNLQNSATVEFRIFKGTLKYESFLKNLEFVTAVVSFAKKTGARDLHHSDFLRFVQETPRVWPHLSAWLRDHDLIAKPKPDRRPAVAVA